LSRLVFFANTPPKHDISVQYYSRWILTKLNLTGAILGATVLLCCENTAVLLKNRYITCQISK
jgi:hypothetical protein